MKAGVITFHSAFNFGASLQTWALQKVLHNFGVDNYVIHYHPDVIDDLYDPIPSKNPLKRFYFRMRLMMKKDGRIRLLRYKRYNQFIHEQFKLIGDCRTYEDLEKTDFGLDAYIVGSDQVWNSDHIGGYNPAYFLEFAPKDKLKIAYAASVGREFIFPKYHDDIKNALTSFDAISIREESSLEMMQMLTDKPVNVVLDPTLLLTKEDYEDIKSFPDPGEKYILVYMMEYNKEFVKLANRISRATGLPIIQRRNRTLFANEIQSCFTNTPGEWLGLIENAEYVFTNSFHGTVFSLIYKKPFISMLHSGTGARTEDLLRSVGEESHLLYNIKDFNDFSQFYIKDPEALDKKIAKLRESSLAFLKDALNQK